MVGKTCLILRYILDDLSSMDVYIPTIADTYTSKLKAGNTTVVFNLFDTAGQQEYARLRQLSYPQTDIFIVCFAVNDTDSYQNARDLWIPEVRHFCPNALILLAGTKTDKRGADVQEQAIISTSKGQRLASRMKVAGYVECSATTGEGVKTVFDTAIRLTLANKINPKRRACSIM
ncbi:likely rho family Ras GTPase [Echinococcus multilocularis]|uniref:Likely rho family Ras GTPase n=1 Tax=Echinococcus multilocularis TaxID=6211 RepID=A0A087W2D6_ECHMU|nr:likely rho family Ras GTPase [Echinococcus multilocularis]